MSFRTIVASLGLFFLIGCASYTDQSDDIRRSFYNGNETQALEKLDKSSVAKSKRDEVLYRMERGMILYTMGNYTGAANEWDKASRKIDELYTISVSNQAASFIVNESFTDYEGEEHEQILVTTFSALSYFANNQPEKAIVEARKSYLLLNKLNKEKDPQNTFSRDAFMHYLAGLIYETKMEWDAAIVEYRLALEAAKENQSWMKDMVVTPIAEALARLADFRNRSDVLNQVKKSYPGLKWMKQDDLREMGEVFVVYESGKTPIKVPRDIVLPVAGNITRVSYPEYVDVWYSSHGASVLVNDKTVGRTQIMQDIGDLARQALSERRGKDTAKMIARLVAKDQAARAMGRQFGILGQLATSAVGAITETADTRGWTLLPDSLQILRVPIPANKETRLTIKPDSGKPFEVTLKLRPSEKRLVRYRTFN